MGSGASRRSLITLGEKFLGDWGRLRRSPAPKEIAQRNASVMNVVRKLMRRTSRNRLGWGMGLLLAVSLSGRADAQFPPPGPTPTPPPTPTATPVASPTPTAPLTPTQAPTETPTMTATATETLPPPAPSTPTAIPNATFTPSPTVSFMPSATPGGFAPPPGPNPQPGTGEAHDPLDAAGRLPETGWSIIGPVAAGGLAFTAFLIARHRHRPSRH